MIATPQGLRLALMDAGPLAQDVLQTMEAFGETSHALPMTLAAAVRELEDRIVALDAAAETNAVAHA